MTTRRIRDGISGVTLSEDARELAEANAEGHTPLHEVCRRGKRTAAVYLARRGADFSTIKGVSGKTPLDLIEDAEFRVEMQESPELGPELLGSDAMRGASSPTGTLTGRMTSRILLPM